MRLGLSASRAILCGFQGAARLVCGFGVSMWAARFLRVRCVPRPALATELCSMASLRPRLISRRAFGAYVCGAVRGVHSIDLCAGVVWDVRSMILEKNASLCVASFFHALRVARSLRVGFGVWVDGALVDSAWHGSAHSTNSV